MKSCFNGDPVTIHDPMEALRMGIAMVHQELQPIPARTIGENIFLGRYPIKKLLGFIPTVDHKKMYEDTAALLKKRAIWTLIRARCLESSAYRRCNW